MKIPGGPLFLLFMLLITLLVADPRYQTVELRCKTALEHNTTIFVHNYITTMDIVGNKTRTFGFGVANVGSGPDSSYSLSQCYRDLSSLDCDLCYSRARILNPKCYPYNGGSTYLDGCFLRYENYSFFQEFTGPGDKPVCGNTSLKGLQFQKSFKKALLYVAAAAPDQRGYSC